MEIGIGLGITRFPGWGVMNIGQLFASGEQGAWYDPSDMSTLFQDSAGTVPVTAVEQPVGRILDKSGRGNHTTQATTTKRPVLSRRVNTFLESEFHNGLSGAPIRGGLLTASALPGYAGAITFGYDGVTSIYAYKSADLSGVAAVLSVVVKMTDGLPPVTSGANSAIDFVLVVGGSLVAIEKIIDLGDGCYRVFSYPVLFASGNTGVNKYAYNSPRTFQVTAYDLRLAADAHIPYQRVNTATDYDADPAKYPAYLRFDGVDDALQTGNIDFTSTDKMTVWAGVTKLSDASMQAIIELSTSPSTLTGTFWINTSSLVTGDIWSALASSGSERAGRYFTATAPSTGVLSTAYDFAGAAREDEIKPRWNGAVPTLTGGLASNSGAGPFGAYPLYIGARAGTSYYFNGRLYSLIVRGAQSSLSQIEATELYVKQKMRLP